MLSRRRVIVYYKDEKVLKDLEKKDIYYFSKTDNYCIIYFNSHELKKLTEELEKNELVTEFFFSNERVINYNF